MCNAPFKVRDPYRTATDGKPPPSPRTNPIPFSAPPRPQPGVSWKWFLLGALLASVLTGIPAWWMIAHHTNKEQMSSEVGLAPGIAPSPAQVPDVTLGHKGAAGIYNSAVQHVVTIYAYKTGISVAHGSGFVLYPGDQLVTNEHVVHDADYIVAETYWGQRIPVNRIRACDAVRDLAVLPIPPNPNCSGIRLAERSHMVGEPVFSIGAPQDTRFGISEGVITQFRDLGGRAGGIVQTDAAVQPGSSGSLLLDADGRVLGVIASRDDRFAYATHYKELEKLLQETEGKPFIRLTDAAEDRIIALGHDDLDE